MAGILWENTKNGINYCLYDGRKVWGSIEQASEDNPNLENFLYITIEKDAPVQIEQIFLHCSENNFPVDKVRILTDYDRGYKETFLSNLNACPHNLKEINVTGVDRIDSISINLDGQGSKNLTLNLENSSGLIELGTVKGHFDLKSDCHLSLKEVDLNGNLSCRDLLTYGNIHVSGNIAAKNIVVREHDKVSAKNIHANKNLRLEGHAEVNVEGNAVSSGVTVYRDAKLIAGGHIGAMDLSVSTMQGNDHLADKQTTLVKANNIRANNADIDGGKIVVEDEFLVFSDNFSITGVESFKAHRLLGQNLFIANSNIEIEENLRVMSKLNIMTFDNATNESGKVIVGKNIYAGDICIEGSRKKKASDLSQKPHSFENLPLIIKAKNIESEGLFLNASVECTVENQVDLWDGNKGDGALSANEGATLTAKDILAETVQSRGKIIVGDLLKCKKLLNGDAVPLDYTKATIDENRFLSARRIYAANVHSTLDLKADHLFVTGDKHFYLYRALTAKTIEASNCIFEIQPGVEINVNRFNASHLINRGIVKAKNIEARNLFNRGQLLSFENIQAVSLGNGSGGVIDSREMKDSKIMVKESMNLVETFGVKVDHIVSEGDVLIGTSNFKQPIKTLKANNLKIFNCEDLVVQTALEVKEDLHLTKGSHLIADQVSKFILGRAGELIEQSSMSVSKETADTLKPKLKINQGSNLKIKDS